MEKDRGKKAGVWVFEALHYLSQIGLVVSAYFRVFLGTGPKCTYFVQPYILMQVCRVVRDCADEGLREDLHRFVRVVGYMCRVSVLVYVVSLGMRVDGIVGWKWRDFYWPIWLLFAVGVGILFLSLSILCTRLCTRRQDRRVPCNEVVSYMLICTNTAFILISIILYDVYTPEYFETRVYTLDTVVWCVVCYTSVLLLLYVSTYSIVVSYVYDHIHHHTDVSIDNNNNIQTNNNNNNNNSVQNIIERYRSYRYNQNMIDNIVRKKPVIVSEYPRYMTKLESSMFRESTEEEVNRYSEGINNKSRVESGRKSSLVSKKNSPSKSILSRGKAPQNLMVMVVSAKKKTHRKTTTEAAGAFNQYVHQASSSLTHQAVPPEHHRTNSSDASSQRRLPQINTQIEIADGLQHEYARFIQQTQPFSLVPVQFPVFAVHHMLQ